jgi:phosphohistidine phosphatase SixA
VSAAAFIQRKLEQTGCAGLILLGKACEERVPLDQLNCGRLVRTVSTAEMLRTPLLKKQAWRDLKSVCALT